MDSGVAQELYEKFAPVMAYVSVKKDNGDWDIGSAFHVGEGVFVTARHAVENLRIMEVAMTEYTYIALEGEEAAKATVHLNGITPVHEVNNGILTISRGPVFHPDPDTDVAAFQVENLDPRTPYVPLGGHLDDWIGAKDFILWEVIVLGYPKIPMTDRPYLFGSRAEVNATIDRSDVRHVHFILSSMARGGFSGGPVLLEGGYALGLVTNSLIRDYKDVELGYMTALSIEPIYECLAEHKLLPKAQSECGTGYGITSRKI